MFNGSNCDRKSQLSGILTEQLNPHVHNLKPKLCCNLFNCISFVTKWYLNGTLVVILSNPSIKGE